MSSLASEDEARYAAAFVKILATVLDSLPVSYAIHAELPDGEIVHHNPGVPGTPLNAGRRPARSEARARASTAAR